MLCSCKLAYCPSCPIMDSYLVLLNHRILWLLLYLPATFSSPSPSLSSPTSALPLHQAFRLRPQSFNVSVPGPLRILKAQLRRVSLTLITSMHILSQYLFCTSSHLSRHNLCNCSVPYGCLPFSIALAWLSCKGMQKNSCLAFFSSAFSKPWINSPNPYKDYILYPFPAKHCSFLASHFLRSPLWQAPRLVNSFKQQ